MKSAHDVLISLLAMLALGCGANIYRAKPTTSACESIVDTECSSPPPDPNRIKLCGSAFANQSDFEIEARKYCPKPVVKNCSLQCCDVDCGGAPVASEAPAAPAASAVPATPPTPAAPNANTATAPSATAAPAQTSSADAVPAPPPPPPPTTAAPAAPAK